jgi:serine/threonine protein kinase
MHTSMLTHGYAPPEQYTANSRKGSYTDIYALGATFYFILTGRVPLEAAARLTEQLVEPKMFNTSIPPEANQTIMKAMKLKTDERYQRVQDFMDDLKNVHHGAPEIIEDPIQQPKSKWWLLWIIVSAVVLLGGIIIGIFLHRQPDNDIQQDYAYSIYTKALDDFDKHLECMNDSDPEQLTNPRHVMGALEELVRIEEYERTDLFKQSGMEPHYQEKLELYEKKIREENETIQTKLDIECSGKKNSTKCQQLEKRLFNNEQTLTQLEQTGSACEVNLEPSN